MTFEEYVSTWEFHHEPLSERHVEMLANDPRLDGILMHSDALILEAVRRFKKLDMQIAWLRDRRERGNGGSAPSRPHAPRPAGGGGSHRSGRSARGDSVWDPPVPFGTTDPRY